VLVVANDDRLDVTFAEPNLDDGTRVRGWPDESLLSVVAEWRQSKPAEVQKRLSKGMVTETFFEMNLATHQCVEAAFEDDDAQFQIRVLLAVVQSPGSIVESSSLHLDAALRHWLVEEIHHRLKRDRLVVAAAKMAVVLYHELWLRGRSGLIAGPCHPVRIRRFVSPPVEREIDREHRRDGHDGPCDRFESSCPVGEEQHGRDSERSALLCGETSSRVASGVRGRGRTATVDART
jgi:hypothetical protein